MLTGGLYTGELDRTDLGFARYNYKLSYTFVNLLLLFVRVVLSC
jgi:hypothetical protein